LPRCWLRDPDYLTARYQSSLPGRAASATPGTTGGFAADLGWGVKESAAQRDLSSGASVFGQPTKQPRCL